jgi:hypothetical protein
MKKSNLIALFLIGLFLFQLCGQSVSACKDIIACGDATAGDYNLLLKVRDPSRPGFQVLSIIPRGYTYTYHKPWTGLSENYTAFHSYIGVTSEEDVPPQISKPGMCLTDAGIAYGDADSGSQWVNPTKHAWDDFDWIRYSCEQADSTDEAAHLLTTQAVDAMHATGVPENLLFVGPDKGYLIEADAYRYDTKTIENGFDVISNYPRSLWKTQWIKTRLIATSFDKEKERTALRGTTIRLGGIYGVRILDIGPDWVSAQQVPFFTNFSYKDGRKIYLNRPVTITLNDQKNVGCFNVKLLKTDEKTATILIKTKQKAWQDTMQEIIEKRYGNISVKDMMAWSRLQSKDLNNQRGMCEPNIPYEGVAIYSIPQNYYSTLSGGWFSPNHARASIYVPFHICNTRIYDAYSTSKAAQLCQTLSTKYQDTLLPVIQKTEQVFLNENAIIEQWAVNNINNKRIVSNIVTLSDTTIQKQAWTMQKLFEVISYKSSQEEQTQILALLSTLWKENYAESMPQMRNALQILSTLPETEEISNHIETIAVSICQSSIDKSKILGSTTNFSEQLLQEGERLISQGVYNNGFILLETAFHLKHTRDKLLNRQFHIFIEKNIGLVITTNF